MRRTLPGLIVPALLLAACASTGSPPDAEPSDPPRGGTAPPSADGESGGGSGGSIDHPEGDEAILVVTNEGGMLPVDMQAMLMPPLVITGDGRVIMQGAQTLEFPGPALPPTLERRLTDAGLQEVLAAFEATNLFTSDLDVNVEDALAVDAGVTVFTLNAGGRQSIVKVGAIGSLMPGMEPPPGMPAEELDAYETLSALNDRLMTLDSWLPADAWATTGWAEYAPEAIRLSVRDVSDEPIDADLPGQVRAWPTDDDPGTVGEEVATSGDGTRCLVVEGEAAALWLAELRESNQNTTWTSGDDRRFAVTPRPLLPHEERACG